MDHTTLFWIIDRCMVPFSNCTSCLGRIRWTGKSSGFPNKGRCNIWVRLSTFFSDDRHETDMSTVREITPWPYATWSNASLYRCYLPWTLITGQRTSAVSSFKTRGWEPATWREYPSTVLLQRWSLQSRVFQFVLLEQWYLVLSTASLPRLVFFRAEIECVCVTLANEKEWLNSHTLSSL